MLICSSKYRRDRVAFPFLPIIICTAILAIILAGCSRPAVESHSEDFYLSLTFFTLYHESFTIEVNSRNRTRSLTVVVMPCPCESSRSLRPTVSTIDSTDFYRFFRDFKKIDLGRVKSSEGFSSDGFKVIVVYHNYKGDTVRRCVQNYSKGDKIYQICSLMFSLADKYTNFNLLVSLPGRAKQPVPVPDIKENEELMEFNSLEEVSKFVKKK